MLLWCRRNANTKSKIRLLEVISDVRLCSKSLSHHKMVNQRKLGQCLNPDLFQVDLFCEHFLDESDGRVM